MISKRERLLTAGWGFAEASVFFIVPDVLLSWYAIQNWRKALRACIYALAGAMLGGALVWWWGYHDGESARDFLARIPAIDAALIGDVRAQLQNSGLAALFAGPLKGIPYKIYAVEAAELGFGLVLFLLVSIPARLMRFLAVAALFAGVSHLLQLKLSLRAVRVAHVSVWVTFYTWYFWVMA